MLIPAALERQITAENAGRLNCELVVEAANGPTTPEADAILAEHGIDVFPDLLASGGGVTVSYFEWVQDIQRYAWSPEEMVAKLEHQLGEAFDRVTEARQAPRRGPAHGGAGGGRRARGRGLAPAQRVPLGRPGANLGALSLRPPHGWSRSAKRIGWWRAIASRPARVWSRARSSSAWG